MVYKRIYCRARAVQRGIPFSLVPECCRGTYFKGTDGQLYILLTSLISDLYVVSVKLF
jgi:hypothetical protein